MPRPLRPLTPDASPRHFVGALLREWRLRIGWSQVALGKRVGASASWISRIEKAERSAPPDLLHRCDQALGTGGLLVRYAAVVADLPTPGVHTVNGSTPHAGGAEQPAEIETPTFFNDAAVARQRDSRHHHRSDSPGGVDCAQDAYNVDGIDSRTSLQAAVREAVAAAQHLNGLIQRVFREVERARAGHMTNPQIAEQLSDLGAPMAVQTALAIDPDGQAIHDLLGSLVAAPDWLRAHALGQPRSVATENGALHL